MPARLVHGSTAMSLVQHRDGADCRECLTQLHCPSPGLQVLPPQQPPKPPDQSGSISRWSTTGTDWKWPSIKVRFFYSPFPIHRGSECTATGHLLLPAPPPNPMSTRALSHPWRDLRSHHQPAGQQARGHLPTTPAYSMKNTLCPDLWVDLFPFFPLSTLTCGHYSLTTVSGVPTTHLAFCKGLGKRWTRDSLPSWSLPILFTLRNSRLSSHATTYVKSFPCFK